MTRRLPPWILGAAVLLATARSSAQSPAPLTVNHELGKRVEVRAGDTPLLTYVHAPLNYGHPHFHPLRTPAGIVTTRSAPSDHIWHNGLWFSWKIINKENFWEGPSPASNETSIEPVLLDDVAVTAAGARFRATYVFKNGAGKAILDQTVNAKVHPPADDHYVIDLVYRFKPRSGDLTFDTVPFVPKKTEWGGYGGLSFRPFEQSNYFYSNADGQQARNGTESGDNDLRWKKSRWVDFSIQADGFPSKWVGVTLMDHPRNMRFPAANNIAPRNWHWNWMQLSLLYEGPFTVRRGKALTLRYRVVVRDGQLDRATLDTLWNGFAKEQK